MTITERVNEIILYLNDAIADTDKFDDFDNYTEEGIEEILSALTEAKAYLVNLAIYIRETSKK